MTTRITPDSPCRICGGTRGSGTDGAHNLCLARAARGLPTPSLGRQCKRCEGRGWWREVPLPVFLPIYFHPAEAARGIAAMFPPCPDCGGTGAAPAEEG